MYLIYVDESGQTGTNLSDPEQPVFVLAALIINETDWQSVEKGLRDIVEQYFPDRPEDFEIHANAIRNGTDVFRQYSLDHRLAFRDACLDLAQEMDLKLVYRAIVKKRFQVWIRSTFGGGVSINPHVAAFPLVARVVDEYLASISEDTLGIFISDENREIIPDVEKAIHVLRGIEGSLNLGHIIEKGFFIDSSKSLVLQLCDLCVYSLRKSEEGKAGKDISSVDEGGIERVERLVHTGNEALQDTIKWLVEHQNVQKKSGQGD